MYWQVVSEREAAAAAREAAAGGAESLGAQLEAERAAAAAEVAAARREAEAAALAASTARCQGEFWHFKGCELTALGTLLPCEQQARLQARHVVRSPGAPALAAVW